MSDVQLFTGLEGICVLCFGSLFCYSRGREAKKVNIGLGFLLAGLFYQIGFALTVVAVGLLTDSDGLLVKQSKTPSNCEGNNVDAVSQCVAEFLTKVAMRVSFGSFIFYALQFLLCYRMTREDDPRVTIHAGFLFWKLLIWIGIQIGFFYIPSSALKGYAYAARVGSGLYVVVQLVLLVSFFLSANEFLNKRLELWWARAAQRIGSFLGFAGSVVLISMSVHEFATSSACKLNIFFIAWTLIMGMVMYGVLTVKNKNPNAGLLSSSLVWLYTSYLLYSALKNEPGDDTCGQSSSGPTIWTQVFSSAIAASILTYSTSSSSTDYVGMFGAKPALQQDTNKAKRLPYRADFFYFVYALSSMYIIVLFTSWKVSDSNATQSLDGDKASTWIKMVSSFLCEMLYIWKVVKPALFNSTDNTNPPV